MIRKITQKGVILKIPFAPEFFLYPKKTLHQKHFLVGGWTNPSQKY